MRVCLLLALFMTCVSTASGSFKKTIKLALGEDYAPLSWGQGSAVQGLAVDLAREIIEKQMKYKLEYSGMPWARAQTEVYNGKYDILFTVKKEAQMYLVPSEYPLFTTEIHVYVKNDPKAIAKLKGVKDLATLNLAPLKFNVYIGSRWAATHLEPSKIEYSQNLKNTVLKLLNSRGDAVVENSMMTRFVIKELHVESDIYEFPIVIDRTGFYILINKKSAFISDLDRLNELIKKFVKTKRYKEIVSKYDVQCCDNRNLTEQ